MFSAAFAPVVSKLENIKSQTPAQAQKIILDNKDRIIKILREEQLNKGIDADNELVGTYSEFTAAFASFVETRMPKIRGAPYNFEWTGGFVDGLYLFFEDISSYTIFSTDGKARLLTEKFGNITDLTDEHNRQINQEILIPELTLWYIQQIQQVL